MTQRDQCFSDTGLSPSMAGTFLIHFPNKLFFDSSRILLNPPTNSRNPDATKLQTWHYTGLGSSLFARRYSGNHYCFLFLQVLRCFTSLRYLHSIYIFNWRYLDINLDGLSHSEISGSKIVCISPKLIAAYHVLHRLHMPRHPLYALHNLTKALSIITDRLSDFTTELTISKNRYYKKFTIKMWSWQGSNLRPSRCKRDALPTELQPHKRV